MPDIGVMGYGAGAQALARVLGVERRRKLRNGRVVGAVRPTMVRWKTTMPTPLGVERELNGLDAVRLASHKRRALEVMAEAGVRVPPFARSLDSEHLVGHEIIFGRANYHTKGQDIVVYRNTSTAGDYCEHCGRGEHGTLEFSYHENQPNQPLPTQEDYFIAYLRPEKEYRYHVAFGRVILPTVKMKEDGSYSDDSLIRNHQDGLWRQVVCREVRPELEEQALGAVRALGLDFGAVDIIVHDGRAFVLEVNTAPGLEVENRLDAYVSAFREEAAR